MSEKEVIKREAVGTIEATGDGRTLDLRIVPYNTKARVTDNGRDFYYEEWAPGVFERQEGAPNRVDVLMNFEHERGIGGVIGRGTELRNASAGAEGTFRMLNAADADKALELVNEGILTGVSLEAEPLESVRDENGVVRRVRARLVNIALCRKPAFEAAQVLAVREAPEPEDEAPAPAPDPEPVESGAVDAVLARIGYTPLASRTISREPWDDSAERFTDEEYERSCLIVREGHPPELPVLEPNGDISAEAIAKAEKRLLQARATVEQKGEAARKLIRYYRQADMTPSKQLRAIAAR